jgi:hypothetical protein
VADSTDLLLTAIVAPIISGLVLFFVGLFFGRKLERADRARQDDQARIYEPLYAQVRKLMSSEDPAKKGFALSIPDTQVIDDIVSHGLLVPNRHRRLKEDVERLADLALKCNRANFTFNVALTKAIEMTVDSDRIDQQFIDDAKSDTALNNAVRSSDKESGVARLEKLNGGRLRLQHGNYQAHWTRIFNSIEANIMRPRADLDAVQTALLQNGRSMKLGLEYALERGKYRHPHVSR